MSRRRTPSEFRAPDVCPVCGVAVPPKARCCPGCGSDETSGWSEQAQYDALDLPDTGFDYGEYVEREFGGGRAPRPRQRFWWWVGLGVTVLFVWLVLRGFF